MTVFVRCNSHRARQKLFALVGGPLKCYFDWDRPATGGYYAIPTIGLADARKIPGVTKAKYPGALRPCLPSLT